jgi:hypothetical protein
MAEPRRDPETGGRSLAEILREAGVESPTRTGRRRRVDDLDDTGIRQRRAEAEAEAERASGRPYGRRAGDLRIAEAAPRESAPREAAPREAAPRDAAPRERRPAAADPATAAIPGVRPSGKPGVPGATTSAPARERRAEESRSPEDRRPDQRRGEDRRAGGRRAEDRRTEDRRAPRRPADEPGAGRRPGDTGRVTDKARLTDTGRVTDKARLADTGRVTDKARLADTGRVTEKARPADTGRAGDTGRVGPAVQATDNPATGPIPVVTDDAAGADAESTPRESALAWARFAGELVIALAAGVGIYFLFTVIWETLPHLAMLVAPLAVTGLVAGIGAYRHRVGRGPVGPRLLAVLVFAGVLLTVAPAAGLLAAG